MVRVLLIVPPYWTTDRLTAELYPQPLGGVMVGTYLRAAGHTVALADLNLPAEHGAAPSPPSFAGRNAPAYYWHGHAPWGVPAAVEEALAAFDGPSTYVITGSFFRPTALRYLAEWVLLRQGVAGDRSVVVGNRITATGAEPKNEVQAAIARALGLAAVPTQGRLL
jgi:hypothetical protein